MENLCFKSILVHLANFSQTALVQNKNNCSGDLGAGADEDAVGEACLV